MSGSRMGVPQMNGNNRRPNNMNRNNIPSEKPVNSNNVAHEYLIKFICDSWNQVSQEIERNSGGRVVYYQEQENHNLKDFEPFDLEAYWGRRVVQNLESNS